MMLNLNNITFRQLFLSALMILIFFAASHSVAMAAIPKLPAPPTLEISQYPNCQQSHMTITRRADKYLSVQSCILSLERFNKFVLNIFPGKIKSYADSIILLEREYSKSPVDAKSKLIFQKIVREELKKCRSIFAPKIYGEYYEQYYNYLQRYRDDIKLLTPLRERFRTTQGA